MRSKDIATLAGITPRALRHYHQIGLLPEPHRDRNGYRRYDVSFLVRLLRIKGLAAAGITLGDMPSFLEGRGASVDDLLATLDTQLLGQIKRLEKQRQLVAQLRSAAAAGSDLPFGMLTEGRSQSSTEAWREQLTLFSHLLGPEDLAKLNVIYGRIADKSEEFLELGRRFDALGPGSDENEITELARDYVSHFEDIFSDFAGMLAIPEKKGLSSLILAHTISSSNESQIKMFRILSSLMN
ncbi:helix-turn-helix domain-containing protein [Sphingosinicella rhizophila]|uniref:MerR family transcriptional regulator n=1 Tax=Sphingosinicella rhizophila TaxID=3050082 RepID=A0ABU3QBK5_9SPHN|nr:MerR family transcriptional regulator [Sphingosinicella sp. GR2756]MDT9600776.1 MerR family transcriptional regulator [Sphingosinicella sp. GR2756]